jgi:hypothetical protein
MIGKNYFAVFFTGAFFTGVFFSRVSAGVFELSDATAFLLANVGLRFDGFRALSALRATRALVIIFGAPCCFAITSLIPETAKIFRTAPQAIIPVPG